MPRNTKQIPMNVPIQAKEHDITIYATSASRGRPLPETIDERITATTIIQAMTKMGTRTDMTHLLRLYLDVGDDPCALASVLVGSG